MDADAAATVDAVTVDGRSRRRARNIDVVVDAMLQLFADGKAWPSAGEVAGRAGLSERSLYRYFDDLDALARAAVETQVARADPLFLPLEVAPDASLAERIDRLVDHRVAMFDQVGPIVQAARARASLHPAIAEALAHRRGQLRSQIEELFAPELAAADQAGTGDGDGGSDASRRDDLLAALEVLTGFEALQGLRADGRRSAARTRRILRRAVTALLRR
jgi:TetR/AcrR family transcriptional regulator, regulator of autoinduction and epiphytic fitness